MSDRAPRPWLPRNSQCQSLCTAFPSASPAHLRAPCSPIGTSISADVTEFALYFGSADDVCDFLVAVGDAHDVQTLVVMLCVLAACPLPCGIPLNLLLETMHHIYAPPPPPEEQPPPRQSPGESAGGGQPDSAAAAMPLSPSVDTFSSPPLLKRSVGSPFSAVVPITPDALLEDVSRSLPFDFEEQSSPSFVGIGRPHRSVQFLVVAACIKPILAASFVALTPSLSLAGEHVRQRLVLK